MHAQNEWPVHPRRPRLTLGKVVLLLLLALLLVALWFVARSGFVPGLAKLVGADEPRDLGITATPAQAAAVVKNLGIRLESLPAATDPATVRKVYAGQVSIDQAFTESDVSALLSYNHVSYWAVKDAQVKIHADGTLEAAAIVRAGQFTLRRDGDVPTGIMRYLPAVLPDELPVYVKGRIDRVGPQQVGLDIQALEIGRVTVPTYVASGEAEARANQYINDRLRNIPGLSIQELSFQDGKAHFKGTWPKEFRRVPLP
ncbi:MAG TPA: hypothetical protein VNT75_00845 [Symbiobacteriaceae bacterium]|nr:hypothetical protein [Symbiobacteriaceae bacterium]